MFWPKALVNALGRQLKAVLKRCKSAYPTPKLPHEYLVSMHRKVSTQQICHGVKTWNFNRWQILLHFVIFPPFLPSPGYNRHKGFWTLYGVQIVWNHRALYFSWFKPNCFWFSSNMWYFELEKKMAVFTFLLTSQN